MEKQQNPIVILGPMESESAYLMKQPDNATEHRIGAYRYMSGTIDGYPVVVGRTYIGMVNAATSAALAIERFDPICVILQGTSGAHHPDLHQDDIVLGERLVHLGRYFTAHRDEGAGSDYLQWTFPGSEIVRDGKVEEIAVLHSDKEIIDLAAIVPYLHGKVIRGTIGAADIWNREIDMIDRLRKELGSDCEEMEGFAVAQVCAQLGVKCADIRVISNNERYPDEDFDEGYGQHCQEFCLALVRKLIQTLSSKS